MAEEIFDTLMDELSKSIQRETTATLERFKENGVNIEKKHLETAAKNGVKHAWDRFKAKEEWATPKKVPNKKGTKRKSEERMNADSGQSKRQKSNEPNSNTNQNADAGPSGTNETAAPRQNGNRTLSTIGTAQNIMNQEVNRLKGLVESLMPNAQKQSEQATNQAEKVTDQTELDASQVESDASNQLNGPGMVTNRTASLSEISRETICLYKGPPRAGSTATYIAAQSDRSSIQELRDHASNQLNGPRLVTNRTSSLSELSRETICLYKGLQHEGSTATFIASPSGRSPIQELCDQASNQLNGQGMAMNRTASVSEISRETICLYKGLQHEGSTATYIASPSDRSPIEELHDHASNQLNGQRMVANRRKTVCLYKGPPRKESTATFIASPSGRTPIQELRYQWTLAKNLFVKGIPSYLGIRDRFEVFLKLCEKMKVTISRSDIENITQKNNGIVVTLISMRVKNLIKSQTLGKFVLSIELFQPVKGKAPWKIQMFDDMTPFYSELYFTAMDYRKQQLLHSFKLTEDGLEVKRTPNDNERVVWTKEQLLQLINK